jgi:hypothetical protein
MISLFIAHCVTNSADNEREIKTEREREREKEYKIYNIEYRI